MVLHGVFAVCRGTRYDALRICIGEKLCQRLAGLRLFMVSAC